MCQNQEEIIKENPAVFERENQERKEIQDFLDLSCKEFIFPSKKEIFIHNLFVKCLEKEQFPSKDELSKLRKL